VQQAPAIGSAIDQVADRLHAGGRLFYVGAGTSGRLGVLDAAECPPTFSTPPDLVQALMAGGSKALVRAVEGAEDDREAGSRDLLDRALCPADVVVGLSASGSAAYVAGALEFAAGLGCLTILVTCNAAMTCPQAVELLIAPIVGPEVLSGSTRLKAGTATKAVLNALSTGVMVRLGKVYRNAMVDVHVSNHKLKRRAERMLFEFAGVRPDAADELLAAAGGSVKLAIAMHRLGLDADQARQRLNLAGGSLRQVLEG
ncbi:MAG: N-acetylmuramic acid 6-phosphate etherase, partial [Cyanobacteria bacterium REEB65]|nr:N-acetylmuramic acid 6-phosphate etherase [Cyanobacteria bacterium REEB65]